MKVAKSGSVYIVRMDPDDDIIDKLQQWCRAQGIVNASITGIGSVKNPCLAHYRRDTKKFTEQKLTGIYELTALVGNIGLVDGSQPLVHVHATLSDETMQAFGGHLVKGICSATAEIILTPLPTRFRKDFNNDIGLKIWDFGEA